MFTVSTTKSEILTYPDKHGELEQGGHGIHSAKRGQNDSM